MFRADGLSRIPAWSQKLVISLDHGAEVRIVGISVRYLREGDAFGCEHAQGVVDDSRRALLHFAGIILDGVEPGRLPGKLFVEPLISKPSHLTPCSIKGPIFKPDEGLSIRMIGDGRHSEQAVLNQSGDDFGDLIGQVARFVGSELHPAFAAYVSAVDFESHVGTGERVVVMFAPLFSNRLVRRVAFAVFADQSGLERR